MAKIISHPSKRNLTRKNNNNYKFANCVTGQVIVPFNVSDSMTLSRMATYDEATLAVRFASPLRRTPTVPLRAPATLSMSISLKWLES